MILGIQADAWLLCDSHVHTGVGVDGPKNSTLDYVVPGAAFV